MYITIDNNPSIDYISETAAFNLELCRMSTSEQLNQIILEASLILDHVMDLDYVSEAPSAGKVVTAPARAGASVVKGGAGAVKATTTTVAGAATVSNKAVKSTIESGKGLVTRVKNFFKKIISFIQNMFARFKDNMQTIFQNSGKWLLDREEDFKKINYRDLSTDLVPYWSGKEMGAVMMTTKDLRNSGIGLDGSLRKSYNEGGLEKLENFQAAYMKNYIYDGSLRDGLLNFYRVGNVKGADRVVMKGDQIKDRIVGTIIPYIKNYEKNLASALKEFNYVNSTLTRIMNNLNERDIVAESFSDLFKTDFRDTEFALHDGLLSRVMENSNVSKVNDKVKDSADRDRTRAGVKQPTTRDNRTSSEKESEASANKLDDSMKSSSDSKVKLMYNYASTQQLAMACFITSMDERYTAYVNMLKAIWKAGNTVGDRDPGKSKSEREAAQTK